MREAIVHKPRAAILDRPPRSTNREVAEIHSLTGLRFVAALSVVVSHYAMGGNLKLFGLPIDIAPFGMQLFFTLSGFVIHYVYTNRFNSSWRNAVTDFSIARFSRLYPLFFLFFVYFVLFKDLGRVVSRPLIALSYLTLTSTWWYWTSDGHAILTQDSFGWSWSISTEWFFYLFYALFIYKMYKIKSAKICVVLLFTILMLALYAIWLLWSNLHEFEERALPWIGSNVTFAADSNNSFVMWLTYSSPYFQIINFVAGCLIAQMYFTRSRKPIRRIWSESCFWLGVTWVAFWLFLYLKMSVDGLLAWETVSILFPYLHFLHSNFLLTPGIVLIMYSLVFGNSSGKTLLSSAYLVFLGEVSYSIYLGHPVVRSFVYFDQSFALPAICLLIAVSMACIFATGLYVSVEVPTKGALRALLQRVTVMYQRSAVAVTVTDPSSADGG